MAKSTPSTTSPFAHLRDLFTATEKKILDSSFGTALADATHTQIEAAAKQARILRDKWRDLTAGQGRKTKRAAAPVSAANSRSNEKADVFHAAVERLEKRLGELAAAVGGILPAKVTTARAKARDKKISGRAVRRTTERPVAPAAPARKIAPPPAPRRGAKPAAAVVAAPVVAPVAKPAKPAAPAKRKAAKPAATISKKARVNRAALTPAAGAQGVVFDRAKQRSAVTAAKAGRLKLEGANTRRLGHTVASGKRQQAKRNGR
jgi:histone H1/5